MTAISIGKGGIPFLIQESRSYLPQQGINVAHFAIAMCGKLQLPTRQYPPLILHWMGVPGRWKVTQGEDVVKVGGSDRYLCLSKQGVSPRRILPHQWVNLREQMGKTSQSSKERCAGSPPVCPAHLLVHPFLDQRSWQVGHSSYTCHYCTQSSRDL